MVYAIVRSGGRQHKVSVGDVLDIDLIKGDAGSTVTLPAVLVVDDGDVTSDANKLGGFEITAEVLDEVKGPKINIMRYKNKTGYRRRQGHRQRHTRIKITGIEGKK